MAMESKTAEQYYAEAAEVKKLMVSLDLSDPTPEKINPQIELVNRNYNKVTEKLMDARFDLAVSKSLRGASKVQLSLATSRALLSPEIKELKSADIRKEASNAKTEQAQEQSAAADNELYISEAYFESVKFVYDNLSEAQQLLKEELKMLNNSLWSEMRKA
jgi:hypothetical protein